MKDWFTAVSAIATSIGMWCVGLILFGLFAKVMSFFFLLGWNAL